MKNALNKAVNVCDKAVGEYQDNPSQWYECRVIRKAGLFVDSRSNVLAWY